MIAPIVAGIGLIACVLYLGAPVVVIYVGVVLIGFGLANIKG